MPRRLPPPPSPADSTVPGTDDVVAFQEHVAAGEAASNAATIAALCGGIAKANQKRQQGKLEPYEGHYGQSAALLRGTLEVTAADIASLPCPALRVGLFAKPGRYGCIGRFNAIMSGRGGNAVEAVRLSLKIALDGACGEERTEMDLLLTSTPDEFFNKFFLRDGADVHLTQVAANLPRLLFTLAGLRTLRRVLGNVKENNRLARQSRGVGPSGLHYTSATAYACGPAACKWQLRPKQPAAAPEVRGASAAPPPRDAPAEVAAALAAGQPVRFDVHLQLATHAACPRGAVSAVEEADVGWDGRRCLAPKVGALSFEPSAEAEMEAAFGPRAAWAHSMAFNVANTLSAHRPLGSANRLRAELYEQHRAERIAVMHPGKEVPKAGCPYLTLGRA